MKFGLLSTDPPTQSGPARFSDALIGAIDEQAGCNYFVVGLMDPPAHHLSPQAIRPPLPVDGLSARRAAEKLNSGDIAVIQYDFGDHSVDGEELLDVQRLLRVPSVIVLHTVLSSPSARQRRVIEEASYRALGIATMSRAARDRLLLKYGVEPSRVVVIPQGAQPAAAEVATLLTRILTHGLRSPAKPTEWERYPLTTLPAPAHP